MSSQTLRTHNYSYDHVQSKTLMSDFAFGSEAPVPGDPFPEFNLPTVDGGELSSEDLKRKGPFLLVPGSSTCPMTKSSNPLLRRLHAEFGDRVSMVLLHVREAHPGEQRKQPHSFEEKMQRAVRLKERDDLPFPVIVDDTEGTLHRKLDGKPNSAWLVSGDGRVIYRALWAGDETGLRQALEAAARGVTPKQPESRRRLAPMAKGIGVMQESIREAGPQAQRDVIKAAPPMAAMAWLADKFQPLSPKWRGFAAMAGLGVLTAGAAAGVTRALRR